MTEDLAIVQTADGPAVVTRAAADAGRAACRSTVSCEQCAWSLPPGFHGDDDTEGTKAYAGWAGPQMTAHADTEGHDVRVTVLVYATGEERVIRLGDLAAPPEQGTAPTVAAEPAPVTEPAAVGVPPTWSAARHVEQAIEQVEGTRTVEVPVGYVPTPAVHAAAAAAQAHAAGLRRLLERLGAVPLNDAGRQEAVSTEANNASTEAYRRVEEFWTLLRQSAIPE